MIDLSKNPGYVDKFFPEWSLYVLYRPCTNESCKEFDRSDRRTACKVSAPDWKVDIKCEEYTVLNPKLKGCPCCGSPAVTGHSIDGELAHCSISCSNNECQLRMHNSTTYDIRDDRNVFDWLDDYIIPKWNNRADFISFSQDSFELNASQKIGSCPCCGSKVTSWSSYEDNRTHITVQCAKCGLGMHSCTGGTGERFHPHDDRRWCHIRAQWKSLNNGEPCAYECTRGNGCSLDTDKRYSDPATWLKNNLLERWNRRVNGT